MSEEKEPKSSAAKEEPKSAAPADKAEAKAPAKKEAKAPAGDKKEKAPKAEAKTADKAEAEPKAEGDKPKAAAKKKADKKDAAEAAAPPVSPDNDPSLSLDPNAVIEKPKIIKAKGSKNVLQGIAHILATFNNTIVTITDLAGNVLGWSSAGKCGFRGSKKATAYVAQVVTQDASRKAMGHGLKEVSVRVKGPGTGRESAVRALQAIGLEVTSITDVTPIPHNGCRARKQRRV